MAPEFSVTEQILWKLLLLNQSNSAAWRWYDHTHNLLTPHVYSMKSVGGSDQKLVRVCEGVIKVWGVLCPFQEVAASLTLECLRVQVVCLWKRKAGRLCAFKRFPRYNFNLLSRFLHVRSLVSWFFEFGTLHFCEQDRYVGPVGNCYLTAV